MALCTQDGLAPGSSSQNSGNNFRSSNSWHVRTGPAHAAKPDYANGSLQGGLDLGSSSQDSGLHIWPPNPHENVVAHGNSSQVLADTYSNSYSQVGLASGTIQDSGNKIGPQNLQAQML